MNIDRLRKVSSESRRKLGNFVDNSIFSYRPAAGGCRNLLVDAIETTSTLPRA